ncbi:hypothetical protein HPC50_26210 [Corallococcus exiguus]|uniref:NACHT domain-containing protein n=1 Tax=Corallococcus TaxID=83461 RepID=UPI0011C478A2|nr:MULTISPECIES: hypothetical protein [Corallococcus]NPC50551.1 hypothetical protein [Corallococcus exiguus]
MTTHELTQLTPSSFEHLVNALALHILGSGHTGFAPGPDGGRDGYFRGEAPYPSQAERWAGRWYIQSKFHAPHLSANPQAWLLNQIKEELSKFSDSRKQRIWPDIWIIATNIDPSGDPRTGSFEKAHELVKKARPGLERQFDIWGGRKILDLLSEHPAISSRYGHFLTPGHILTELAAAIQDDRATADQILKELISSGIEEQKYTKLEQAGASVDSRPGVHRLFVDLPFKNQAHSLRGLVIKTLSEAAAQSHRPGNDPPQNENWASWRSHPKRSPVWLIQGGPGNGKSTLGQYFCQIHRAALILSQESSFPSTSEARRLACEIEAVAKPKGTWPNAPRVPIHIELKDYAQWYGEQGADTFRGVLSYLKGRLSKALEQPVLVGTLKRMLTLKSWLVVFDGLDEVPGELKDDIASEVKKFIRLTSMEGDALTICTSRPQGYSGQFDNIALSVRIELTPLTVSQALACAEPLVRLDRSSPEAEEAFATLRSATQSTTIRELMTTPLQAHIMAVVVRGGKKPPERKWEMYNQFYEVIRAREANRNLPDKHLSNLLRQDTELLKAVHNKLGFTLHSLAETAVGAQSSLPREDFNRLVSNIVNERKTKNTKSITETLMQAATQRLVLISTPDDGTKLRFDIRQLQEFFAAEHIYEGVEIDTLRTNIGKTISNVHWREVMHFLISALVEQGRRTELSVAIEALQQVDEVDGSGPLRLIGQRMAIGATIVARLIEDGVLEQNKSLRNLFRDRLTPLATSSDMRCLDSLLATQGEESRLWLTDVMSSHMAQCRPQEAIGASRYLWSQSSEDSENLSANIEIWKSLSPEDFYETIRVDFHFAARNTSHNSTWKSDMLFDFLTSDLSGHFSAASLQLLLGRRPQSSKNWLQRLTQNAQQRKLRTVELAIEIISPSPETTRIPANADHFGIVTVHPLVRVPEEKNLESLRKISASEETTGVWRIVRSAASYATHQTVASYYRLLLDLGEHWTAIDILPIFLRSTIPIPNSRLISPARVLNAIRNLSDSDFHASLQGGQLGGISMKTYWHRQFHFDSTESQFRPNDMFRLIKQYPHVATELWCGNWSRHGTTRPSLTEPATLAALFDVWSLDATHLFPYPHSWGRVFDRVDNDAHLIRSLLATHAHEIKVAFWPLLPLQVDFQPFEIDLEREGEFLRIIASSLVSFFSLNLNGPLFARLDDSDQTSSPGQRCSRLAVIYAPRIDGLREIYTDSQIPPHIRAGALTLSVLHPGGGVDEFKESGNIMTDLASLSHPIGLQLAYAADLIGVAQHPHVLSVLGRILEITGRNRTTRQLWDSLFRRWRERSLLPGVTDELALLEGFNE